MDDEPYELEPNENDEKLMALIVKTLNKRLRSGGLPDEPAALLERYFLLAKASFFDVNKKEDVKAIEKLMANDLDLLHKQLKVKVLWGDEREQLLENITDECGFITYNQLEAIKQFPYDALDALYDEVMGANIMISYADGGNGDLVDQAKIDQVIEMQKAIIKSYINSRFVTAVHNSGHVTRGRLTNDYPASESGELVFIDYSGLAWDVSNFSSFDPPLYGGESEQR